MSGTVRRPPAVAPATVEILLSSYNRRDYLAKSLDSVLAQSWADLHVVVVDDASPDGAGEVAKEYARRFPDRVTAICKPHRRGLAHSVNLGLSLMKSAPFVAFQADDDLWHPEKLQRQLDALSADPALGMVATEAAIIDADGELTGERLSDICGVPDLAAAAPRIFARDNFFCATSVLVRRSALELVNYQYPLAGTCNDMYMWLVISSHRPVGWIDEPLTYYRRIDTSFSMANKAEVQRETFQLRRYAFDHFEAVRAAVGGEPARRWLEEDAIFWALWHLRRLELKEYGWYVRDVITESRSLRAVASLAYQTVRSGLSFLVRTAQGRVTPKGRASG